MRAKDANGEEPLHYAACNMNAEATAAVVAALAAAGADVRAKDNGGHEPLHLAAFNQNADAAAAVVAALAAAGADVRAKDANGEEPLHSLVCNCNANTAAALVTALVAAGADVRAKNNKGGFEPLHGAAANPNAQAAAAVVAALVAAGADVNCSASDGSRPLHHASHLDTALLLVRLGASLSLRDNAGRTTLEAAAGGNTAAQAALRQASISERRCAGCGAGGERLKRCIRCRAVSYCG